MESLVTVLNKIKQEFSTSGTGSHKGSNKEGGVIELLKYHTRTTTYSLQCGFYLAIRLNSRCYSRCSGETPLN